MMGSSSARLDELGRTVALAQDKVLEEQGHLEQVRARLLRSADSRPERRGRRAGRLVLSAAAVAAVAGVAAVLLPTLLAPPRESISFTVQDRPGHVGRWLAPRGRTPLRVQFSDGSHLMLRPGSGARVRDVEPHGARVLLEHGSADVAVARLPGARWELEAGPFRVKVLGTRFRMAWHPDDARFELSLGSGRVGVAGPVLGTRTLRPGESVKVWVGAGRMELQNSDQKREKREPRPTARPRVAKAAVTPPPAEKETPRQKPRARRHHFRAMVHRGQYRAALEAAGRAGWATVLRKEPASSLQALGDAARLAGEHARARQIYLTLRRRFRGGPRALAAFSLGRVAFDAHGEYPRAARWFQTYLDERPSGPLRREAMGRLLEARHLGLEIDRARQTATDYLKRFPDGPHARLARSVLSQVPR